MGYVHQEGLTKNRDYAPPEKREENKVLSKKGRRGKKNQKTGVRQKVRVEQAGPGGKKTHQGAFFRATRQKDLSRKGGKLKATSARTGHRLRGGAEQLPKKRNKKVSRKKNTLRNRPPSKKRRGGCPFNQKKISRQVPVYHKGETAELA